MSLSYRITIRISSDVMEKLEKLVKKYHYNGVSEVIRRAIEEFIAKNETSNVSDLDLKIPGKIYKELEEKVSSGEAVSIEELIREILKEYVKEKTKSLENKR